MITIKSGSRNVRKEQQKSSISLVWQGPKSELEAYLATLTIGLMYTGLGNLVSADITQESGPLWNLNLAYATDYSDSGNPVDRTVRGPYTQTLSARVMSMPLETHANYKANWNNYLIGRCSGSNNMAAVVPSWWSTATDTALDLKDEGINYRWVHSLSETPAPTETESWGLVDDGTTVCRPTKPGVESYDKAFYVITEIGEHDSKTKAGWVTSNLINTIVSSPLLGDFGLSTGGYNWKVDDISVQYTGKVWHASRTYTRSGDSSGWDSELYGTSN